MPAQLLELSTLALRRAAGPAIADGQQRDFFARGRRRGQIGVALGGHRSADPFGHDARDDDDGVKAR